MLLIHLISKNNHIKTPIYHSKSNAAKQEDTLKGPKNKEKVNQPKLSRKTSPLTQLSLHSYPTSYNKKTNHTEFQLILQIQQQSDIS